jgi:hypothetical protein
MLLTKTTSHPFQMDCQFEAFPPTSNGHRTTERKALAHSNRLAKGPPTIILNLKNLLQKRLFL